MNGPAGPFDFADEEPRGGKRRRILSILGDELRKVPSTEIVAYAETRTGIDVQVAARSICPSSQMEQSTPKARRYTQIGGLNR